MASRRWPVLVALVAVVLTLPSVGGGLLFDDYHAKIFFQRPDSPVRLMESPLDLFRFIRGPQQLSELRDFGFVPWWTYTGIKAALWRPLTSATHWLDYALWPNTPSLMHLHSILWYAGVVAVLAVAYRRFMGPTATAGLAALLFAVDEAHGMVVGFLANRNDLPALVFGVLCVIAHDRWRRQGWRAGVFAAPVLFLLSLLSKESGISTCAYLAAYELFLSNRRWAGRLRALLPYAAVVIGWRIVWSALDYGVTGIPLYVDPVREPGRFALDLFERAPLLLLAQWLPAPSEISSALVHGYPGVWLAAVVLLALVAVLLTPLLRQDRVARFWTAGMVLSVIPACEAFPMDRMLVFVGIGAMGLVAQYLMIGTLAPAPCYRLPRAFGYALVAIHLVVAPVSLPFRAAWPMGPRAILDQLRPAGPMDPTTSDQDLIIVNPPEAFVMMECPLIWSAEGHPMPRHMRILMSSRLCPVEVYRPDDRTLVVRPEVGFIHGLADPLLRGLDKPLSVGQRIELVGMTVEITELRPDKRPAEAAFRFRVPLEDHSLRWLQWRDGEYVPFIPPAVGQQILLPGGRLRLWPSGFAGS